MIVSTGDKVSKSRVRHSNICACRQRGFTLLELLIALLISSILLVSMGTMLQSSGEARNRVSSIRQLHEDTTLLSQLLSQQLAQVAYRPIDQILLDSKKMPVQGHPIKFLTVENEWVAGQVVKADNTSFTFRFSGADDADGNPDGSITSCLAMPVGETDIIDTRLFIRDGQLGCEVNNQVEILAGSSTTTKVEEMFVEIGVDNDDDLILDSMIPAESASETDFLNARLVRLRLLLASADRAIKFNQSYRFRNQNYTSTDFRLRKEVVVAMAIRN